MINQRTVRIKNQCICSPSLGNSMSKPKLTQFTQQFLIIKNLQQDIQFPTNTDVIPVNIMLAIVQ